MCMKQQFDYPRSVGYENADSLSEACRQIVGYNASVIANYSWLLLEIRVGTALATHLKVAHDAEQDVGAVHVGHLPGGRPRGGVA